MTRLPWIRDAVHRGLAWPLHVAGLSALAFAQPLLDLLGANPEFFVAHRAGRTGVLAVLAALVVALPALIATLVALAGVAGARARRTAVYAVIGAIAAIVVLPPLQRAGVQSSAVAFSTAVLAGLGAAALYARSSAARSFATVLSAAVLVVPLVFLAKPGIRTIVFTGDPRGALARLDPAKPPIVLFVFDELPLVSLLDEDREIDPVLYPNLSALARDGAWFRNATAVADYTRFALPAILDGQYPSAGSIPTPADHPDTLFTLLGRTHRIEAFEAVTTLCPESLCPPASEPLGTRLASMADDLRIVAMHVFLPGDLARGLPDLSGNWGNFAADDEDGEAENDAVDGKGDGAPEWRARWTRFRGRDKAQLARDFIDGISAADAQPTFYFMHSLVSHHPYHSLPDGRRSSTRVPIPGQRDRGWENDAWEVAQNYQRHLMQIEYVDALVGRAVRRLKDAGLYGRTMLVITADHGISFEPGGPLRQVTERNPGEIMPVPLVVKWPEGTAAGRSAPRGTIDRNVETIDIAPTVAAAAGTPLTGRADGRSLTESSWPERRSKALHVAQASRRIVFGREGPDYARALARKLQLFGSRGNRFRIPRPPKYAGLIGTPVAAHETHDDAQVEIRAAWRYGKVSLEDADVPFDVAGRVRTPAAAGEPLYVAVAVNGTIHAVTRTWAGRRGAFNATPPADVWHAGHNTLEAFVIAGTDAAPVLRRGFTLTVRPADLNLISGAAEHLYGVELRGFYRHEGWGTTAFRWTRGHGQVLVPTDPDAPPRAIRITLARSGAGKRLRVAANGCTLFDGAVPQGAWTASLPLDRCRLTGGALELTLDSPARRSPHDRRRLGVAVKAIVLEGRFENRPDPNRGRVGNRPTGDSAPPRPPALRRAP